jgi:thiol:disulfide interchange protein
MSYRLNRRHFINGITSLIPMAALPAFAGTEYTPGLVDAELAAGKTVFLDFKASWCTTCAAQERVIEKLKAQDAAYEEAVTFIDVDWDQHKRSELTKRLKVPRRSTLIVLKGDIEIGRIIAGTAEADIKALMDAAVAA